MQQQKIRRRGPIAFVWTAFAATAIVLVACSWVTLTSLAVQAADPNNILLDFSARWCGPCQQMSPLVSKLERQGYPIRQVDVDREGALARQFNVESIPCFILVANGKEVSRITGATDEGKLISLMKMLPTPKPGVDPILVDGAPKKNGPLTPTKTASTSADEKKSILKLPQLFAKNQEPKSIPAETPGTVRGQNPAAASKTRESAREALAASVRIRVKNGKQIHYGSGTLIDSQPDRAIILTCGHILRGLNRSAIVEVDLFAGGTADPQTMNGQIVQFDLDADVGLISIPSQQRLPTVKLAVRSAPEVDDRVISIGCGGGTRPAIEDHIVMAINSCVGPDNLECDGVPQQGRSGGGLFAGPDLIGVCILADPKFKRGIYTGMKPIVQLLEKAKLGYIVNPSNGNDELLADDNPPVDGPSPGSAAGMNDNLQAGLDDSVLRLIEDRGTSLASNSTAEPKDYIGSEIVCIVRPRKPGAPSRVVIVNQASTRFINDLLHESGGSSRSEGISTARTAPQRPQTDKQSNPSVAAKDDSRAPSKNRQSRGATIRQNDRPVETSFESYSVP